MPFIFNSSPQIIRIGLTNSKIKDKIRQAKSLESVQHIARLARAYQNKKLNDVICRVMVILQKKYEYELLVFSITQLVD